MGWGDFGRRTDNVTDYVLEKYNETKYLEPPLTFKYFVRRVSQHLPKEVQVGLISKEIRDWEDLEATLDGLQGIRDREIEKRNAGGAEINQGTKPVENHRERPEWRCANRECSTFNYDDRTNCCRCGSGKGDQRRGEFNRGGHGGGNRGSEVRGGSNIGGRGGTEMRQEFRGRGRGGGYQGRPGGPRGEVSEGDRVRLDNEGN